MNSLKENSPGRLAVLSEMTSRGSVRLEDARRELLAQVANLVPKEFSAVVDDYFDLVAPID